jgi:hypothetical protein
MRTRSDLTKNSEMRARWRNPLGLLSIYHRAHHLSNPQYFLGPDCSEYNTAQIPVRKGKISTQDIRAQYCYKKNFNRR